MKFQGDVGIKTQAEVVVEDIQGQLEKGQGTKMRTGPLHASPAWSPVQPPSHVLSGLSAPRGLLPSEPSLSASRLVTESPGMPCPPSSWEASVSACWMPQHCFPTHHVEHELQAWASVICLEQCWARTKALGSICQVDE